MFNESIIKKIIKSELDIDMFYGAIENLNYEEYMKYRNDLLSLAVLEGWTTNTRDAKDQYWSRLIKKIKKKYDFVVPVSTSLSASQKRHQRMGKIYE